LISIKFNADLHRDGLGAQLQRQVATFCLARYLKVNFLPSEIKSLDFNPGDGITDKETQEELLTLVNTKLKLGKARKHGLDKKTNIKFAKAPTKLWKLKVWFAVMKVYKSLSRTGITFIFDDPYLYVNQNVNLYKNSKYFEFELDNPFLKKSKTFNVAIHIPRAKVSPTNLPERYHPTIWYVNTLDQCLKQIGVERRFVNLYIHTDAPLAPTDWKHSDKSSPESQEYWKRAGILDENGRMKLNFEDFRLSFSGFLSTEIIRDVSPIVAWANISHCDVFLLGKSSFSFMGALLNRKGIRISPRFFIEPPNNWILSSDDSCFSFTDKLRLRCTRLKIFNTLRKIRKEQKICFK
jgi:hypothetical protein